MGAFFRGWRRKMAVVTLVMACAFIAAWVRSFNSDYDRFDWEVADGIEYTVGLPHDGIWLSKHQRLVVENEGKSTTQIANRGSLIVPYWLIVIPLTLLSAYLLFRKPRPRNPLDATKPTDEARVTHA